MRTQMPPEIPLPKVAPPLRCHFILVDAARDVPASQDVVTILEAYLDENPPDDYAQEIDDHFMVSRIEPGTLWLEPFVSDDREIGPVPVRREVTHHCRVGWDISGVAVKTRGGWRLLEVWNVSP